jgi:hypothetical protein
MALDDVPDRFVLMAIGLLLLLAPVVLIVTTFGLLVYTGDLILDGVTPLVFVELYLLEIGVLAAFAYALYRLMTVLVLHRLPVSSGASGRDDTDDSTDPADTRE